MPLEHDTLAALESARRDVIVRTERARAAARDARRLADDVRIARSSATSVGGEVTVRASAAGAVEAIEVARSALDLDERVLSRLLTETVRKAQREAAELALSRMSETLGETSPLVSSARDRVATQFGTEPGLR